MNNTQAYEQSKQKQQQQQQQQQTVIIAGATGYCGKHLVQEFKSRPNHKVKALVRRAPTSDDDTQLLYKGVEIVIAEATKPETLKGVFDDVDIVVSALGITRQRDGVTYKDVDYQGNVNLLEASIAAGVSQFGYIHVIHGNVISNASVGVACKQAFVDKLQQASSSKSIQSTVICPSGFFSDMKDFLDMAQTGRVYLFGNGQYRLNPIHGIDLAKATVDAIEEKIKLVSIGGPDIYTHTDLATLALAIMNKPIRITYIWDGFRRLLQYCLPWLTPISVYGPAQFFLQAFGMDMVGDCVGTHHLKDYWQEQQVVTASKTT